MNYKVIGKIGNKHQKKSDFQNESNYVTFLKSPIPQDQNTENTDPKTPSDLS